MSEPAVAPPVPVLLHHAAGRPYPPAPLAPPPVPPSPYLHLACAASAFVPALLLPGCRVWWGGGGGHFQHRQGHYRRASVLAAHLVLRRGGNRRSPTVLPR